jgi:hypothetical protein
MRGPSIAFFSCIALAAAFAGCGGGGGGAGAPVMPGRATNGNTSVQVTIVVPQKTNAQGKLVPKFVSPSTQSAIVEIIGPVPSPSPSATPSISPSLVVGAGYANFTPGSSACSTGASGLSCTVNIAAPITQAGTYAILVITLDAPQTSNACIPSPVMGSPGPSPSPTPGQPQCAGVVLGYNIVETNITPGSANPVNVTLGGFPVFLQPIELVSGLVGGGGNGSNALTVFGSGTSQVSFELLDGDKNIIAGNGALQLSVSSNPFVTGSITATPSPTGVYTLSLTPVTTTVGGQNIVQAGTSQIFLTATWPGATALTTVSQTVPLPVTVKHSVIYEARNGGMVDAYMDGNNTTPAYSVYGSGFTIATAVNPVDESLWIADYGNNDIVVFPLGLPGAAPSIQFAYCGMGTTGPPCNSTNTAFVNPTYVAFDASGNLFVSTYNGSIYQEQEYAPAPGATAAPSGAFSFAWNGSASLFFCHAALDNTGRLFVGNSTPALDQFSLGTPGATVLNGANVNGVGWAPDGSLWYLNYNGSTMSTATKLNTFNPGDVPGSIPGLPGTPNQALAVDMLGNVYIATGQGTASSSTPLHRTGPPGSA